MESQVMEREALVIGAGISGLATAKCLQEAGLEVTVLERSCQVGGLWTFRPDDYGVMSFTHINVSKYNYCFSDFPFPEASPDFPHHSDMASYIRDYARHFRLLDLVEFNAKVTDVEQIGEKWRVTWTKTGSSGEVGEGSGHKMVYVCSYLAICTGHHAKASYPQFPGEDTFLGEIVHSVSYKDCVTNQFAGQRVLIVGIGNSAVDAAVDCATLGRCPSVCVSTRSGAWVVPNYLQGFPIDLYSCRFFFKLPRALQTWLFEIIISLVQGNPWKWNLRPKMRALETQPTVSPTLIHHIQRKNIKIVPNITRIQGRTVHFVNGHAQDFDKILYCTGYKIDLPFLSEALKSQIINQQTNEIKLFKNVFAPSVGPSLALIGFVQPASGGILSMSEIQARWFGALNTGQVKLPSRLDMEGDIRAEKEAAAARWYQSERHTIQKDPIEYCDDISAIIGARPDITKTPTLARRLLFSSGGAAQYRLVGPHRWAGAPEQVRRVPMPDMWKYTSLLLGVALIYLLYSLLQVVRCLLGTLV